MTKTLGWMEAPGDYWSTGWKEPKKPSQEKDWTSLHSTTGTSYAIEPSISTGKTLREHQRDMTAVRGGTEYAVYQPGEANDVWPDGRGDWHLEHRSADQEEWQVEVDICWDSTGRNLDVMDCAFLPQFLTLLPQVPKAPFKVLFDFKGPRDWRKTLAPQEELTEISSDLLKFKERTSPF